MTQSKYFLGETGSRHGPHKIEFNSLSDVFMKHLESHAHFDSNDLRTEPISYHGPDSLENDKIHRKRLPGDERVVRSMWEYYLSTYRSDTIPGDGDPVTWVANNFRQYIEIQWWDDRSLTIGYDYTGRFEFFEYGVDTGQCDIPDAELIDTRTYMSLLKKYPSPEHIVRRLNDNNGLEITVKYIIDRFLN